MARSKKRVAELVARFQEGLESGKMRADEATWIIAQLQEMADQAVPHLIEVLSAPERDMRAAALTLLRDLEDRRAVPVLRRLLNDPDYDDDERMFIIQILEELGFTVDEATFRRVIADPEAMMERAMNNMLEVVSDPAQAEIILTEIDENWPEEMQLHYVRNILQPLADRRLLLILSALLHSEHDEVILAAIETLESLKEPAAIPLLEERGQYDPSPRVRRAAGNAALRLQMRIGDQPPQPWLQAPSLPLTHCMISSIDGNGGQVLFLARRTPDGDLYSVDWMFNDHQGVKDCFSTEMEEDELDLMAASFGIGIDFIDIRLERAREAIVNACQVNLEAQRRFPVVSVLWRGWLEGEDDLEVEEFPLPVLDPARQAELLADCNDLLQLDEFSAWFFNPDEVEEFGDCYRELKEAGRTKGRRRSLDALIDQAVESLIDEPYRRLLSNRLRRQAWLLAQLYEEEVIPLWALAAAAALEEGVVVGHPLLRGMMHASFLNIEGQLWGMWDVAD
ncbi:MAG: HEAT repeat domain-containing protein [Anaerolineae bacterium]|nr:HEAT repeat domain-containing protein [Anaerolineae bacterium]